MATAKAKPVSNPEFLEIGGEKIPRDSRVSLDLPVAQLYTHTPLTMPVQVIRGKKAGPTLFVSAAVHGDEINGVEIVRRVLAAPALKRLRGTLIAVPIVNVHGFLAHTRYLPDRRDLNRSFPGSPRGSVAGRLAHLFASEIVAKADCGIDLHTAAIHRDNLPQIRANLHDERTAGLAAAFGAPIMINSDLRDGSLRAHANELGIPMLLFEAGEALRFDEASIRVGVMGVLNVMRKLEMLAPRKPAADAPAEQPKRRRQKPSIRCENSSWVRAEQSGILRATVALGDMITKGQSLAIVADPFGRDEQTIISRYDGVVIGRTNLPLVNEGDALFHIGYMDDDESRTPGTREELLVESDRWLLPAEDAII